MGAWRFRSRKQSGAQDRNAKQFVLVSGPLREKLRAQNAEGWSTEETALWEDDFKF